MKKIELGLRETARRHDISPGYLSQRVRAGKPAKGYDLAPYVTLSSEGVVEGFAFPEGYEFPASPEAGTEQLRENPAIAMENAPNRPNTKNKRQGDKRQGARALQDAGEIGQPPETATPALGWKRQAARVTSDLCKEDPERAAAALLHAAQLAGATGVGLCAGKYVYDRTLDGSGAKGSAGQVRTNPEGEEDPTTEGVQSVLPAIGVGVLAFLGADYGLRGDESLAVRAAQWLADQFRESPPIQSGEVQPGTNGSVLPPPGARRSNDSAAASLPDVKVSRPTGMNLS